MLDQTASVRDYQEYLEKTILKLNFNSFTQIVIEGIVATSAKKKAAKKEVEVEVTETAEVVKPKAKATRKPKTEE